MGCRQCNKVDVSQLGYGFKSLEDDETGRTRKRVVRRNKVDDELKQKFEQEIKNHGELISEEEFNAQIGQDLANEYKTKPYLNDAFKEPDPKFLIEPGPIKLDNGSYYNGTWNSNGKMDGYGQFFARPSGERLYINGLWDDGDILCAKVKAGNNTYEGCIRDGLFHGKGKMEYADGNMYEGTFKNGKKDGTGKLTFTDGTVFEGNFVEDEIGKNGKFTWRDGKTYEGELLKGIFNGKGTLNDPDRAKYEGEFKNGIFHGKGKYTWYDYYSKSIETYDGEYFDGKKNGYGVYTFNNKEKIEGYFESGELQGESKYSSNDGYTYTLQYAFGQVEDYTAKKEKRNAGEPKDDFDFIKLKEEEDIKIEQLPNVNTDIIKALYLKTDRSMEDRSIQGYKFEANKDTESSVIETKK